MDTYVGPYRILRLIKHGGQGSVYLGYDRRLHRRVAIKLCDLPARRAARRALFTEAQLVAGMHSQKVVQVHDVIQSRSHLAIVMEYVAGCSLEDLLQRERPSLGSVLTVGADIAGALTIARQQHIVHGDIKPGNILITQSGRAKLTDFGIARKKTVRAPVSQGAGSEMTLSPECFRGHSTDERADIFALGCVLYRMLSGHPPFFLNGTLDARLLLKSAPRPLEEVVPPEVALPAALVALIAQMLQKTPRARPATTRQVRQILRLLARDIPITASNSLLLEARPCFRAESLEDTPLPITANWGRRGRSRLLYPAGRLGNLWQRFKTLSRVQPNLVVVAALLLACPPVLLVLQSRATPVQFGVPNIIVDQDVMLPPHVSSKWLLAELRTALEEQLGTVLVIGALGNADRGLVYSARARQERPLHPEQVFHTELSCIDKLCVLAINRTDTKVSVNRQGVMLAGMNSQQWREVVHRTAASLYD